MGLLTITTDQVQDLQTTIKEDLEAGTWTNYGSTPKIHTQEQKKSSKNTWIEVLDTTGEIIQAMNNAIIFFDDRCEININAQNRTDLNKLYADFLNITTSARNYKLEDTRDLPLRSKYNKNITISLKDK